MEAAAVFADLDFEALTRRLAAQFRGRPFDDAEEAIADAALEVAAVAEREVVRSAPALVLTRARWRMLKAVKRADREVSLDDLAAPANDEAPREVAVVEDGLDAHLAIREAADHPVLAARLRAAAAGASPIVAPRGVHNHAARYTDEQITEVRRLRAAGRKFAEIEAATGVEQSYAAGICRRAYRVLPSSEGWTDAKMIEAVQIFARREGRAPTYQEGQQRPDLPNPATLFGRGVTWRQLLDRAGVPSSREWRRCAPWTREEADREFWTFYEREGRWPTKKGELRSPLPSSVTARKLYGTWRPGEIGAMLEAERATSPAS